MALYQHGDYVKVEFPDETTGIGEWMWVRVDGCDEQKQLVFGTLDNEPLNDYGGKMEVLLRTGHQLQPYQRAQESLGFQPPELRHANDLLPQLFRP